MATARQRRGRRTQELVAQDLHHSGTFPGAYAGNKSEPGRDIKRTPGWSIEVKATRDGSLTGAIRQADANAELADDYSAVIWRPDGYGETRINNWVVAMPYGDWKALLRDAGYGDPRDPA